MIFYFVLFEHLAGYGLSRLQVFEEIATFLPPVEESFTGDPLAIIKSVSEGIFPEDLELFRETNMPKGGKGAVLGVSDSKLSASINDGCGIKCSHIGVVIPEVISAASCKKDVQTTSLGMYCVRFGSDIKQFCSIVCLDDYMKGLKVCSYCQKDISGGEGFLAPIGENGQFKDFCEQSWLQNYELMHLGKETEDEVLPCFIFKETIVVAQEITREMEVEKLCSILCFFAFKFYNSVETHQCDLCTKYFDVLIPSIHISYIGLSKIFCSKPCQNLFVMQKRKIVPCVYCKVKKFDFYMMEKFPPGQTTNSHLYCFLNCLNLHNMQMVKLGTIQSGQGLDVVLAQCASDPVASAQARLKKGRHLLLTELFGEDEGEDRKHKHKRNNSNEEIKRMVNDVEKFMTEDDKQKDRISAKNGLESYCFYMKTTLEVKVKDKISKDDMKTIMYKWLYCNQLAEVEEFNDKQKEVEGICNSIITKLYQGAGGMPDMEGVMPGAGAAPGAGEAGDAGPTIEEIG